VRRYLAFESVAARAEGESEDIAIYADFRAEWEGLDEVKATRAALAKAKAAAEKAAAKAAKGGGKKK
jgi:hypothetical protein